MRQRIGALGPPHVIAALLASVLLIAPTVSSYTSAALYALIAMAFASYARGPAQNQLQPVEKLIALIFAAYFLVGTARGLFAPDPAAALVQTAPNLVFLLAAPMFPLLRRHLREADGDVMLAMLAAGGVVIGIYSQYYGYTVAKEFDPPTGNALVLALFCGLAGLILFERAFLSPGPAPWLLIAGFAGATAALWLTARRSVILAYLICVLILVVWSARHLYWARLAAAILIVAACAAASPVGNAAVERFSDTKPLSAEPSRSGSTGDLLRKSMLIGGARAFLARPLIGHGRQNAVSAANTLRNEGDAPFDHFNHLHSAPLTEAVSAGLPGLAAFLALFVTPLLALRQARGSLKRAALTGTLFFALCSLLNIGFYIDATASAFVLAVTVLNALALTSVNPPSAPTAS